MPRETELYRLELEQSERIFRDDEFLSISELARRLKKSRQAVRKMFDDNIPSIGISRARYAKAISK